MNEDKRKNVRLQGKYSTDKDSHPKRSDKGKRKYQKDSENASSTNVEKVTSPASGAKAAEGTSVEYKENSSYSFKEHDMKKCPEELSFDGYKAISETRNGTSSLIYEPQFLHPDEASEYMIVFRDSTKWHDKNIVIRGEEYPQPRLVAWYGPFPYTYSGATLDMAEMPASVIAIKKKVEDILKLHEIDVELNSVLLNLYRNGKDSVAWHSDDELTMGVCPTIASVSLGVVRRFEMRPKGHTVEELDLDPETIYYVNLAPGSLIIMDGCMQKDWQHRVPKEYHDTAARINLTFRTVYAINRIPLGLSYKASRQSNRSDDAKLQNKVTTIQQPKPVFDLETFPSLESASCKSKPFGKSKISYAEASAISPPNGSSNDIKFEEFPNEGENENILTQNYVPIPAPVPNNQGQPMDFNLNEMEHFSKTELPFFSNPDCDSYVPDVSQRGRPDGTNIPSQIHPESGSYQDKSQVLSSDPCVQKEPPLEDETEIKSWNTSDNKPTFNINAPDFVPKNIISAPTKYSTMPTYDELSLQGLARCYTNGEVSEEEMDEFGSILIKKINSSRGFFTTRDGYELEVLSNLMDGSQTEKNRKLILDRFCSMIRNANDFFKRERQLQSPHGYRNQRPTFSRDFHSRQKTHTNY